MNNEALLKALNHITELRETIFAALVPAEAQRHFRSSRREALLGLRTVLDHSIQGLEDQLSEDTQAEKMTNRTIEITD